MRTNLPLSEFFFQNLYTRKIFSLFHVDFEQNLLARVLRKFGVAWKAEIDVMTFLKGTFEFLVILIIKIK